MFIPVAPYTSTTVINKTIVYSDTVLNLKDLGNNIKVNSIKDVSEFELERCLKTVFESNPDVTFNTIQYSKNDKKVYFYTNKEITKKTYEESKLKKYKPIALKIEILEEVKNVLITQKNKDNNCISLYDVAVLLKKFRYEYDSIKKRYENYFEDIVQATFNDNSSVIIYNFDYENKFLRIGFRKLRNSNFDEICFAKQNGDLYVAKSESCWSKEVFEILSSKLSEMYDELLKYTDYKDSKKSKYDTKSVNSNFCVDMSHYGAGIFVKNFENEYTNEFKLFAPSYDNDYSFECNSSIVNEAIKGKEDELFKRIFVKISDCPEWSQVMLYEIRQNQLAEEQRIEDEKKYQEMKKQKRLELRNKIFPFLKK